MFEKDIVETKEYIAEKFKDAEVGCECPICGSGSRIEFAAYGGGVYLDCNLKPDEHNKKATEEEKRVFFKSGKGERQPGEFGR